MTSSSTPSLDGRGGSPVSEPALRLTTARHVTNGAPCLGLAVLAAGLLWAGLGSTVALLLV